MSVSESDRPELSRSDMALRRRAAREKWGVPDDTKGRALEVAERWLESTDPREVKAALHFLRAVDRIDQADERLELERRKLEAPAPSGEARDAWAEIAAELLHGSGEDVPRTPPGPAGGVSTPGPGP